MSDSRKQTRGQITVAEEGELAGISYRHELNKWFCHLELRIHINWCLLRYITNLCVLRNLFIALLTLSLLLMSPARHTSLYQYHQGQAQLVMHLKGSRSTQPTSQGRHALLVEIYTHIHVAPLTKNK